MSYTTNKDSELSVTEAQKMFEHLVETQRATALWYLDSGVVPSVTSASATPILDGIARHCSRDVWMDVRTLKAWRSQNTNCQ